MDVFSVSADSLFPIASEQNAQKEQYAMRFLQKGLEEYTAGEYRQAMLSFKQAVGLAPQSSTAINAYDTSPTRRSSWATPKRPSKPTRPC